MDARKGAMAKLSIGLRKTRTLHPRKRFEYQDVGEALTDRRSHCARTRAEISIGPDTGEREMHKRNIIERLLERHEKRKEPIARQRLIRIYEKERREAADEIQRLQDQLSAVHATAADNEYAQWERITELETVLREMLQVFGKPIHDGSVDGEVSYKGARAAVNRARAALVPPTKSPMRIFSVH
jgi:hypothetical protein